MPTHHQTRNGNSPGRNGAILPLIAIMLPLILLMAGFAINIAYIQLCQTELQISTDVAAKAAGRVFAVERNEASALRAANNAGALNLVAGEPLVFDSSDIRVGRSVLTTDNRYTFVPAESSHSNDDDDDENDEEDGGGSEYFNAIEIAGNRNSERGSEIGTFFPSFIGSTSFGVSAFSVSTQVEVEIALVIDRSGSMAYAASEPAVYPPIPESAPLGWEFGDPAPDASRWRDAVSSVEGFLNELRHSPLDERVALVTYADGAVIDQGLTNDYSRISSSLAQYSNNLSGGGTNIAGGLNLGKYALINNRDFAAKVVIILTDGKRSVGGNPVYWAENLADDGVMVISVTFSDEADTALMKKVSDIANGFHVHAQSSLDLIEAFRTINRRLPTLLTK